MANVRLSLTPVEAKIVYNILDGQADAGACAGGNTEQESEALQDVIMKLLKVKREWINTDLDPG